MEENGLVVAEKEFVAANDVLAVARRRKRLLLITFAAVMCIAAAAAIKLPEYESVMKIMVNRERLDPVVSPDNSAVRYAQPLITEEEMNSELEILKSDELLQKVAMACGLQQAQSKSYFSQLFRKGLVTSDEVKLAKAVRKLRSAITVEALRKSNVIVVRYSAAGPKSATTVLNSLIKVYLDKHTEVHTPPGQFEFFDQQAEHYREELTKAETSLAAFAEQSGTVAGQAERDLTLAKLSDLRVQLQEAYAAAAEEQRKVSTLKQQLSESPDRITTLVRQSDNGQLLGQLKSTLLTLELRRSELLQKYQPDYPLVQQAEREITQAKTAIENAEHQPLIDQSTDRDPTVDWLRAELAKSRTELEASNARAASLRSTIGAFEQQARQLNDSALVQQELARNAKALEESYELYLRKREEARIANALNTSKILNVTVVQAPTAPAIPTPSPMSYIACGLVAAIFLSTVVAFTSEYVDQTLHTPEDVRRCLGLPVLAALPKTSSSEPKQLRM